MEAVYFIASYDITDPDRYERDYVPGVVATLAAVGGEVIVASGSTIQIEGAAPGHTVVVRFPSEQAFRGWYDSEPLHATPTGALRHHRQPFSRGRERVPRASAAATMTRR